MRVCLQPSRYILFHLIYLYITNADWWKLTTVKCRFLSWFPLTKFPLSLSFYSFSPCLYVCCFVCTVTYKRTLYTVAFAASGLLVRESWLWFCVLLLVQLLLTRLLISLGTVLREDCDCSVFLMMPEEIVCQGYFYFIFYFYWRVNSLLFMWRSFSVPASTHIERSN